MYYVTVSHYSTGGVEDSGMKDDVLLVAILVPILSVLVLLVLLGVMVGGGCRWWAKRCALTQPTISPICDMQ